MAEWQLHLLKDECKYPVHHHYQTEDIVFFNKMKLLDSDSVGSLKGQYWSVKISDFKALINCCGDKFTECEGHTSHILK